MNCFLVILQSIDLVVRHGCCTVFYGCAISDSSDEESSSGSTRRQRQASTSIYPVHYPSPPVSPEDSDPFRFHTPAAAAVRARSVGKDEPVKDSVTKIKDKANIYIRGDSLPAAKGYILRCFSTQPFLYFFSD
jgi:hypothetical protein